MQKIVICDTKAAEVRSLAEKLNQIRTDQEQQIITLFDVRAVERYLRHEQKTENDIFILDLDHEPEAVFQLMAKNPQLKTIYLTNDPKQSEQIFRAPPTAFLLKPVQMDSLQLALELVESAIQKGCGQSFYVTDREGIQHRLSSCCLRYAESEGRLIRIFAQKKIIECYRKLGDLEQEMQNRGEFLRCHQRYLVNVSYIKNYQNQTLVLTDDTRIPVSRSRKGETEQRLAERAG